MTLEVNMTNTKYQNGTGNIEKSKKRSNPNILSRLFFWWMCPVLVTGNRRDVEEKDLIVPNKHYDSERQGDYFER